MSQLQRTTDLLAAKGPLEFQQIYTMQPEETKSSPYVDMSDEAEAHRFNDKLPYDTDDPLDGLFDEDTAILDGGN